jgi:hypothetical protein
MCAFCLLHGLHTWQIKGHFLNSITAFRDLRGTRSVISGSLWRYYNKEGHRMYVSLANFIPKHTIECDPGSFPSAIRRHSL